MEFHLDEIIETVESAKKIQERFKNNYELDKGMIRSSESIWKDIEKI